MAITIVNKDEKTGKASYRGLSTDTKPTTGVAGGSIFLEINTGDIYEFNTANTNPTTSNGWWKL